MARSTYETVAHVLTEQFHVEPQLIAPEVSLGSLGLDSLSLVEFVFSLEDHFGLRIPEERLDPRQGDLTLASVCAALDAAIAQRDDKPAAAD